MYLLNPAITQMFTTVDWFTFHYVSIKSQSDCTQGIKSVYLHSTMYLLNPNGDLYMMFAKINLHSTMYLLNREFGHRGVGGSRKFTFHYVSIKSNAERSTMCRSPSFTFHYVSIKSCSDYFRDGCEDYIYIPLCIY